LYQNILERDMLVLDKYGTVQKPVTEKNIIHFILQPKDQALKTYKNILREYNSSFPSLNKWLENFNDRNA